MIHRAIAIAVAAAVLSAHAPAARADDGEVIGILDVEVVGVSDTAAEMFEASLETGLGNAGFRVAKRERMRELLEPSGYIPGCRFGPCLKTVYDVTGVRLVLVARITGIGKNFSYLVTLVDTRTGLHTAQDTDECPVCTVDEAVATASLAVIGLVTGASNPEVTDPSVGPTGGIQFDPAELRERERALDRKLAARRRSLRRGGVFLLGMAALAAGASAVGFADDNDTLGAAGAAAAGAFAVGGATVFALSRRF
ncbi:MAG: hypothetical protein D6689_02405 [Deltaproteobacteria bacterium]|nr:MAG: hypothetical protein D6689_02405 [Deltaproteobacteria bacterium]